DRGAAQLAHGEIQSRKGEGKDSSADEIAHDASRRRGRAARRNLGVHPHEVREGGAQTPHPLRAGLRVPVLDAAAWLHDLMWAHARIADQDHAVVTAISAQHALGRYQRLAAALVVLPHAFVEKVVEVEMFQALELTARRGKQLLADAHVAVHRAANIEKQQHLDGIVPLRNEVQIEQAAVAGGGIDRALEVELLERAFAWGPAQPAQRESQVAGAELDRVVEVSILTPFPYLHC